VFSEIESLGPNTLIMQALSDPAWVQALMPVAPALYLKAPNAGQYWSLTSQILHTTLHTTCFQGCSVTVYTKHCSRPYPVIRGANSNDQPGQIQA